MAGQFREFVKPFVKVKMKDGTKKKRSKYWPKVRLRKLKNCPCCANCGKSVKFLRRYRMQVHHIIPFHINPSLELVPSNLITLCGNPRCHLDKGHLGNFKSYNPNVIEDCKIWKKKYQDRP